MRVKISKTGLYVYPEVVVSCDEPEDEQIEIKSVGCKLRLDDLCAKVTFEDEATAD